jgi:hypothetical protein
MERGHGLDRMAQDLPLLHLGGDAEQNYYAKSLSYQ